MDTAIVFLDKQSYNPFLPCMLPTAQQRIKDLDVFGYGAVIDGVAAGAVVCEYNSGIVNILSLGVSPSYQRQQVATQLIVRLTEACSQQHYREINTSYYLDGDKGQAVEQLLVGLGFSVADVYTDRFRLRKSDIAGSWIEKRLKNTTLPPKSATLVSFDKVSLRDKQLFMRAHDISQEDWSKLNLSLSYASVKNGMVEAAVLMAEAGGVLELAQIYSDDGTGAGLAMALFASLATAYRDMPATTEVNFSAINEASQQLAGKLLQSCGFTVVKERFAYMALPRMSYQVQVQGGIANDRYR